MLGAGRTLRCELYEGVRWSSGMAGLCRARADRETGQRHRRGTTSDLGLGKVTWAVVWRWDQSREQVETGRGWRGSYHHKHSEHPHVVQAGPHAICTSPLDGSLATPPYRCEPRGLQSHSPCPRAQRVRTGAGLDPGSLWLNTVL